MDIIGRKDEKQELNRLYLSDSPEFAIVYGRRRVGKTFLVRETLGHVFTFYATGVARGAKEDQLSAFYTALKEYGLPLKYSRPETWADAFELLKVVIERSTQKRKVIFIDEMPWMDTAKSKFLEAIELFWNKWASARADILLIGCGSAAAWMVKNIVRNRGGLHNRITCKIKLLPFTLKETKNFLLSKKIEWDIRDIAETYMILGGIPYYLNLLDRSLSLAQNIDRLFFKTSALLEDEFDNLYSSLFKNASDHKKIIEALSKRKAGLTREAILTATKLTDGGTFGSKLDELEQCGFIRKYKAVGSKGSLFQLTDFYTLFYFKFLGGHKSGDEALWMHLMLSRTYSTWCGLAFERLCMSEISVIKECLGISGIATRHYSLQTDKAQVDMLIERADRIVSLCEMKYYDRPYNMTKNDVTDLERKVWEVKEKTHRNNIQVVLITPFGVSQNKYSTNVIHKSIALDDMMG